MTSASKLTRRLPVQSTSQAGNPSHQPMASDSGDSNQSEDYQGSLEGESEDEWAEERKAVRYMAESEMEDAWDSDDNSSSEGIDTTSHSQSIGYLLKSRQINKPCNMNTSDDPKQKRKQDKLEDDKISHRGRKQSPDGDELDSKTQPTRRLIPSRPHKHAPIEITSKKAVTRKRTIVQVPKVERRDPRFDTLSGAVNEDLHERSFGFLKSQRQAELEKMRQALAKAKKTGRKTAEVAQFEEELRREENKEVQREKIEREKLALRAWKASEKEKRKEGKGAFYLKKKAQKQIVLADRYEHLSQNKSKLHKSIEKKRKKIDGKEKKSMPFSRQRRT